MVHGGHCVAQYDDRVVFVRHAIPGETVVVKRTGTGPSGQFWLADTIEVIQPSEFRRAHQWKLADPLRAHAAARLPVGGAEYGHIVVEYQRRLKATVFRDTMVRLGRQNFDDIDVSVIGVESDGAAGLRWRTRNTFLVSATGRLCLPVHHHGQPVPVRNIPLAVAHLDALELWELNFTGALRVAVATPNHGRDALITITPHTQVMEHQESLQAHVAFWQRQLSRLPEHVSAIVTIPAKERGQAKETITLRGRSWVQEEVASQKYGTHSFRVSSQRPWPVHRDGAVTLVEAVMKAADPQPGQVVADLYAGPGLYSRFLADAVGPDGAVLSVEAGVTPSQDASVNLQAVAQATVLHGNLNRVMTSWLRTPELKFAAGGLEDRNVDTVVLNPPRQGAGRAVISRIHQLEPTKIVYIASGPTSLARDARRFNAYGWRLESAEVYDLAPETQHMDSIGVFTRS